MEFPLQFPFFLRTGTSIGLKMDQKRRAKQHDKYGFFWWSGCKTCLPSSFGESYFLSYICFNTKLEACNVLKASTCSNHPLQGTCKEKLVFKATFLFFPRRATVPPTALTFTSCGTEKAITFALFFYHQQSILYETIEYAYVVCGPCNLGVHRGLGL